MEALRAGVEGGFSAILYKMSNYDREFWHMNILKPVGPKQRGRGFGPPETYGF